MPLAVAVMLELVPLYRVRIALFAVGVSVIVLAFSVCCVVSSIRTVTRIAPRRQNKNHHFKTNHIVATIDCLFVVCSHALEVPPERVECLPYDSTYQTIQRLCAGFIWRL